MRPCLPRAGSTAALLLAAVAAGPFNPFASPALAAGPAVSPAVAAPAEARIGRVIVTYRDEAAATPAGRLSAASAPAWQAERATRLAARLGLELRAGRAISERQQVVMVRGLSDEDLATRLAGQPEVAFAEPDRRMKIAAVPNDPRYAGVGPAFGGPASGQWYLKPPDATIASAIDAERAWDIPGVGGAQTVVAVLDTGIRFDHPDLPTRASGLMLQGYDMIVADDSFTGGNSNFGTAGDNDGRDNDPSDPGDFLTSAEIAANPTAFTNCSPEASSSWHGTQVAGLIAALANNNLGMAGMARNVQLLPVRVLGKCGGYTSDIATGIRWAAGLAVPGLPTNANPARVINLSLGGSPGPCSNGSALQTAVAAAVQRGAVVVAAGGNDPSAPTAPANCAGAIGVAGVRHTGVKVGYSAFGSAISIAAPAGNCVNTSGSCLYPILSTSNAGTTQPVGASNEYTDGTGNFAVGTSFASPLVAGAAALVLSVDPALSPAQVKTLLEGSARPFPPNTGATNPATTPTCPQLEPSNSECYCTTATCGAGLLDARAAVQAAAAGGLPVVPPAPSEGGGGGGALGAGWLLALAFAAVGLRGARRRRG
jgi:serine protease